MAKSLEEQLKELKSKHLSGISSCSTVGGKVKRGPWRWNICADPECSGCRRAAKAARSRAGLKKTVMILLLAVMVSIPMFGQNYIGLKYDNLEAFGLSYQHLNMYSDGVFEANAAYTGEGGLFAMNLGYRFTRLSSNVDFIAKGGGMLVYRGDFKTDMNLKSSYQVLGGCGAGVLLEAYPIFIGLDFMAYVGADKLIRHYVGLTIGARISKRFPCEDRKH
jgi:hypothetical protein